MEIVDIFNDGDFGLSVNLCEVVVDMVEFEGDIFISCCDVWCDWFL